jgi:Uma2 family endonuclease
MTALPLPPEPRPAYPRRPLTVADYLALPEDPENRTELQEGMVVMAARPIPRHRKALVRLITQLEPQLPGGLALLPEVDIDLQLLPPDQPGTVRVPDLVVVTAAGFERVDSEGGVLRAGDIILAVEIHSPGTRRTDSVIKYHEYADAGIDHYWKVELDGRPTLAAWHRAGEFGDADADPVQGTFTTDFPFLVRIDLDGLR